MKELTTLGIDLAKNIFQLYGTDTKGKKMLSKRLKREELMPFIVNLPPCLIGIEACTGAHHWARRFQQAGHTVKMMSPQFVKPYVQGNKNDSNDAIGINEAVKRPHMKFVAIKTVAQQDMLLIHRIRELAIKQRTALANQIRGLLAEYGMILPKGISHIGDLPLILEDAENNLTPTARELFTELYEQFKKYDERVIDYDKKIEQQAKESESCQRLMKVEGVGPLIATATVATVGDPKVFKNGRELSAFLGLVPRQHSSGNKIRLLGISKRGDKYLRKILVQGAKNVVRCCEKKQDVRGHKIAIQMQRCHVNVTAVAVANKNVRIMWALLAKNENYRAPEKLVTQ